MDCDSLALSKAGLDDLLEPLTFGQDSQIDCDAYKEHDMAGEKVREAGRVTQVELENYTYMD